MDKRLRTTLPLIRANRKSKLQSNTKPRDRAMNILCQCSDADHDSATGHQVKWKSKSSCHQQRPRWCCYRYLSSSSSSSSSAASLLLCLRITLLFATNCLLIKIPLPKIPHSATTVHGVQNCSQRVAAPVSNIECKRLSKARSRESTGSGCREASSPSLISGQLRP